MLKRSIKTKIKEQYVCIIQISEALLQLNNLIKKCFNRSEFVVIRVLAIQKEPIQVKFAFYTYKYTLIFTFVLVLSIVI